MTIAPFSLGINQADTPGDRAAADRINGKAFDRQFGFPIVMSRRLYTCGSLIPLTKRS
jgi:hypothetical protein